jgi:hypothetical protein
MVDFFPVRLLFLAQRAERRFEEMLMACPREGDRIRIDDREVFTRLLDERLSSLYLSLAALEAYLGYLASTTSAQLAAECGDMTLKQFLEDRGLEDVLKTFPNRLKRRHQLLIEEFGDKPLRVFLGGVSLSLEDKFIYWTLLRTGAMVSFKDGYVKKFLRIKSLAEEILTLNLEIAPELGTARTSREVNRVFLRHELPEGITPGKSASGLFVTESYAEGHLLWEVLHCYPARMVQEIVQYLHKIDGSENHFIIAVQAAATGEEETLPRYTLAIRPGE